MALDELWLGAAKDFVAKNKPQDWGKREQALVNFTAITEGLTAELSPADQKHLLRILLAGENTSACAQGLRKVGVIAESQRGKAGISTDDLLKMVA